MKQFVIILLIAGLFGFHGALAKHLKDKEYIRISINFHKYSPTDKKYYPWRIKNIDKNREEEIKVGTYSDYAFLYPEKSLETEEGLKDFKDKLFVEMKKIKKKHPNAFLIIDIQGHGSLNARTKRYHVMETSSGSIATTDLLKNINDELLSIGLPATILINTCYGRHIITDIKNKKMLLSDPSSQIGTTNVVTSCNIKNQIVNEEGGINLDDLINQFYKEFCVDRWQVYRNREFTIEDLKGYLRDRQRIEDISLFRLPPLDRGITIISTGDASPIFKCPDTDPNLKNKDINNQSSERQIKGLLNNNNTFTRPRRT